MGLESFLTHIDLFSGIGGFALAAQWAGFKTVCFVEINDYAQAILKQNFGAVAHTGCNAEGRTPFTGCKSGRAFATDSSPQLFTDIRDFDATRYRGATLLTGGFPCQPFSQAGQRRGAADDRALWPEMFRVIREARPAWVVGENVAGFVTMELDNCISDLEREGYAVQPLIIPACAVDARHRRDRVWIVGHAEGERGRQATNGCEQRFAMSELAGEDVADAGIRHGERWATWTGRGQREHEEVAESSGRGSRQANGEWLPEPDVGRVAHGVSRRVDRLKGLGNAIVPQVAYEILKVIAEIEK